MYGLLTDNIVELDMVDAKGQLLIVNASSFPDLLWAHRGGVGGNFGIVTRFKFKIYPAPKFIVHSKSNFDLDNFPEFFNAFQTVWTSLDWTMDYGLDYTMDDSMLDDSMIQLLPYILS